MPEAALAPSPAPAALSRPRLGFVGTGWIGRNRLDTVAASGRAEIAAIADATPGTAAAVAAACAGEAWVGESFEALLEMNLDGIVIATPSALHAAQAIAALEAGCAVFCQKPLARTEAETREVIAAARRADRLLGVDLSYRFTSGMQQIRQLILSGELGTIYAVEVVFHNAYGPDKAWFYDRTLAGGGCLIDLGTHLVDLALWSLGRPEVTDVRSQLRAQGRPWAGGAEVEDYATGQMATAGGAAVQLACSWKAPAGCNAEIGFTVFGTRGGASLRNVGGSFYDFRATRHGTDQSVQVLAEPPEAWAGRAVIDWVQRLAVSPAFDPEIEHLSTVAAVIDRMYARATP